MSEKREREEINRKRFNDTKIDSLKNLFTWEEKYFLRDFDGSLWIDLFFVWKKKQFEVNCKVNKKFIHDSPTYYFFLTQKFLPQRQLKKKYPTSKH